MKKLKDLIKSIRLLEMALAVMIYAILAYFFKFQGHLKDIASFTVFLPINYFVGIMGWKYIGRHIRINKLVYWLMYWFIALSYIPGKIIDFYFPEAYIANALLLLDAYWFTAREFFVNILVPCILIGFIIKKRSFLGKRLINFSRNTPVIGISILILLISYLSYGTWSARNIEITNYDITVPKKVGKMGSLNVVMLSDIHMGRVINNERVSALVKKVNNLKPDIVLIVGDSIEDEYIPYVRHNMAATLKQIHAKLGTYAVLGNHDMAYNNTKINIDNLNKAGVTVLKDQYIKVAGAFYLVGRSDRGEAGEFSGRAKIDDIIKGVDKSLPIILMDHQPIEFDSAAENGVDVQLSGHTHYGQELRGKLMASLAYKLPYGILHKNNFCAIVSSGFGTWGSPVRVGTKSEIVNIQIAFSKN